MLRLLRRPEVEGQTGLSRSSIYRKIAEGSFPRPVRIGRAVRWKSEDVDLWIRDVVAAHEGNRAPVPITSALDRRAP